MIRVLAASQHNALYGGSVTGAMRVIRFTVGTAATTDSATSSAVAGTGSWAGRTYDTWKFTGLPDSADATSVYSGVVYAF
jgi:hypothetical protein